VFLPGGMPADAQNLVEKDWCKEKMSRKIWKNEKKTLTLHRKK